MASTFPTALDNFRTDHVTGEVIQAHTDNDYADALNKVEARVIREAALNPMWPEYGAVCDGSTDDTSAWETLLTAAPDGAAVTWTGNSKIQPGRSWPGRLAIRGQGERSAFTIAGGDNSQNGITLGGTDGLRYFLNARDFVILGGASCCNHALVILNQIDPNVDVRVKAGATVGVRVEGVQNTKRGNGKITVSNNTGMAYSATAPTNGVLIVGSALIPTNANHFDIVTEALSGYGTKGDGSVGVAGGYNNSLRGVFQGNGGVDLSLKLWTDFDVGDLSHVEDAADADDEFLLTSCQRGTLGPGLMIDGNLNLVTCSDLDLDGINVRDINCPTGNLRIRRGRIYNNGGTHNFAPGTSYSTQRLTSSDAWNPGSIADGGVERNPDWVHVVGARPADDARARFDLPLPAGMWVEAHVVADDYVATTLVNRSGTSQDIGAGNVYVDVSPH